MITEATTTTGGGVAGRDIPRDKIIGRIGNRRVKVSEGKLMIPECREGRALRALLGAGSDPLPVEFVDRDILTDLRDLIDALLSEDTDCSDVRDKLISVGVRGAMIDKLTNDEWVTLDRIDAWWNEIQTKHYKRIDNVVGLLIGFLRSHTEPPMMDIDGGWSYVTGKYADEIEF